MAMIYELHSKQIPEEIELVWDDGVAPETCVDFDAPQVPLSTALLSLFAAASVLLGIAGLVYISDPEGSNPVAPRSAVIPYGGLQRELGVLTPASAEEE